MPLNVAYVEIYNIHIRACADGIIQRLDLDDLYPTLRPAIAHDHPHDEIATDPGGSTISLAINAPSASRLHTTLYICHDGIPSRCLFSLLWLYSLVRSVSLHARSDCSLAKSVVQYVL